MKENEKKNYSSRLGAGLGLVTETKTLLELWENGVSSKELFDQALQSGLFPNIAARRLRNIIAECFAPRYLTDEGKPAQNIKILLPQLSSAELKQLLLLYTCRSNRILFDFVKDVYWEKYSAGYTEISGEDALRFVRIAVDRGLTAIAWSESVIKKNASYLTGCCADYGLLETGRKSDRKILPFRISPKTLIYLAYDLHFFGLGDNSVLEADDWQLFGLHYEDVFDEMKRISTRGYFIVQSAAGAARIDWKYKNFKEVIDVITQN